MHKAMSEGVLASSPTAFSPDPGDVAPEAGPLPQQALPSDPLKLWLPEPHPVLEFPLRPENPDFCQLISVLRWKGFYILYKQRSRLACSLIVHSKLTVLTKFQSL